MIIACLDVYTRSDTIEINGKATRIGTKEEVWTQLQRCRVEKKVLEQVHKCILFICSVFFVKFKIKFYLHLENHHTREGSHWT